MTNQDFQHPAACPFCGSALPDGSFVCMECKNIAVTRNVKRKNNKTTIIALVIFIALLLVLLIYRLWEIASNKF